MRWTSGRGRPIRRGSTLVELLITMIVLAITGTAFLRLMVYQSRHFADQAEARGARSVARSAVNVLLSDLRMVETPGGIVSALPTQLTVRVPYAFGIHCATSGGTSTISLLPIDSAMFAEAGTTSYAWRGAAGAYTYVESGVTVGTGAIATCTGAGIMTLGGGRVITLTPALPAAASVGAPVLLSRRVTYGFLASVDFPGRIGLWRGVQGVTLAEEIAAPFDATARFRFYVLDSDAAQDAVPSPVGNIRGLEVLLYGQTEGTPSGGTAPKTVQMTTAVFFKNRLQ